MAKAAATKGDKLDGNPATTHTWTNPSTGATDLTSCSFKANINSGVSANVFINRKEAATVDSIAEVPVAPEDRTGLTVDVAVTAKATITAGSNTVTFNSKGAARHGDSVKACTAGGRVVVSGTPNVLIGD